MKQLILVVMLFSASMMLTGGMTLIGDMTTGGNVIAGSNNKVIGWTSSSLLIFEF